MTVRLLLKRGSEFTQNPGYPPEKPKEAVTDDKDKEAPDAV
jgi:hypothetical protein